MGVGPSAQSLCVSSCLKLRQFSTPSRQFYIFLWVIFPHDHSELRLVSAMPELASNGIALNSFVIILLFAALIAGFCFAISRLSYIVSFPFDAIADAIVQATADIYPTVTVCILQWPWTKCVWWTCEEEAERKQWEEKKEFLNNDLTLLVDYIERSWIVYIQSATDDQKRFGCVDGLICSFCPIKTNGLLFGNVDSGNIRNAISRQLLPIIATREMKQCCGKQLKQGIALLLIHCLDEEQPKILSSQRAILLRIYREKIFCRLSNWCKQSPASCQHPRRKWINKREKGPK